MPVFSTICATCALVFSSFTVVINNQRQGQQSVSFRHTPYILRHMCVLFYRSLIFEEGKLSLKLSHATCLSLLPVNINAPKRGLGSVVWRYMTMKVMLLIFTLIISLCGTQAAYGYEGYGGYGHYEGYGGLGMHWPLSTNPCHCHESLRCQRHCCHDYNHIFMLKLQQHNNFKCFSGPGGDTGGGAWDEYDEYVHCCQYKSVGHHR